MYGLKPNVTSGHRVFDLIHFCIRLFHIKFFYKCNMVNNYSCSTQML